MTEYLDDLQLSTDSLDESWIEQPLLYAKYGELVANATEQRDNAKQNLDVVKAQKDSDIRSAPELFGFDKKPTEAAIANVVILSPEVREATQVLIDANKELNILTVAKTAFDHRKKALEGLTQLFISNYFQSNNSTEINCNRMKGK